MMDTMRLLYVVRMHTAHRQYVAAYLAVGI